MNWSPASDGRCHRMHKRSTTVDFLKPRFPFNLPAQQSKHPNQRSPIRWSRCYDSLKSFPLSMDKVEASSDNGRSSKRRRRRNISHNQERHIRQRENRLIGRLNLQPNSQALLDYGDHEHIAVPEQSRHQRTVSSAIEEEKFAGTDLFSGDEEDDSEQSRYRNEAIITGMHNGSDTTNFPQHINNYPNISSDDRGPLIHQIQSTHGRPNAPSYEPPQPFLSAVCVEPSHLGMQGHVDHRCLARTHLATCLYGTSPARDLSLQWDEHESLYDERYGETTATDDYSPMPLPWILWDHD